MFTLLFWLVLLKLLVLENAPPPIATWLFWLKFPCCTEANLLDQFLSICSVTKLTKPYI